MTMKPWKTLNATITINDENTETTDLTTMCAASPFSTVKISAVDGERITENYRLVWVDNNLNDIDNDTVANIVTQLRQVINSLKKFNDIDRCIDFIRTIEKEKVFMICSEEFGEKIVPLIHGFTQIASIYIFCENKQWHQNWNKEWYKIQGTYTDINSICEALQQAVKDSDHNTVSISFVKETDAASKQDIDSLDKSFMYTQILKEILLTIDFEEIHFNEFLLFCREQFANNSVESRNIDKIEREYHDHQPIWWYTYQSFLYKMLNRALRLMEVDIIIKMGFFLKDLHNHILELHFEQFNNDHHSASIIVYRGQGLSQTDFDELQQTQGGLLSFNNFLSTSTNREVSLRFVRRTINSSDLIGVLFVVQTNLSVSTTPFANVKDVSHYKGEDEILFSMHSIFRIGQIKQLDGNTRLWEVDLTLTSDTDPQLHALTEHIRKETLTHKKGWFRLGNLLYRLGQFDEAEQVCNILLPQTIDEEEKASIYQMFGLIKNNQGKYENAVEYSEESIKIYQKYLSPFHSGLAASYNNLGLAYNNMGEYSKALSYDEKAIEIQQKTLPENHPDLASSYGNIGEVYRSIGEYSKALSYYEKVLEIRQQTLPENHPDLAKAYNNIGEVYRNMGEYSKALSYYEKALEIWKKTLPENHPLLATSYNNIASVYTNMEEHLEALSYYEKALELRQKTLSENHPDFAQSYNNIGLVYMNMEEYSKALSYHEKALEIWKKTLPENHPHLATSYNNIGLVYYNMEECSKALSYFERALEILEKTLPENHPHLASSYNNIASLYNNMNDYRKALQYLERALIIYRRSLPPNHPDIENVEAGIEFMKTKL